MAAVILLAFSAGLAMCQPAPSFEAASIRLNKSSKGGGDIEFLPGAERFSATNVPLAALILTAYNLTSPQCSCSSKAVPVLSERFDIQAKAEHPVGPREMLRLLQSLLADRFKLAVRHETKDLEAYALVIDKGGPKLRPSKAPHFNDAAPLNPYHARGVEGHSSYALDLVITDATMADLAWRLSSLTILEDHVVVDKTGLDGRYDFELKFAAQSPNGPPADSDAPSIFTALREQLGLRLDARKIPLEVLSVEHAERPARN
jgi:uncharacterized protein (TIGR03435 family)